MNKFKESASAAAQFFDALLKIAKPEAARSRLPSLLELLTICRETGSRLLELETFAASRDRDPAFLLCGGEPAFAREFAERLGITAKFTNRSELPLIWWIHGGGKHSIVLRIGNNERQLSAKALDALLESDLPQDKHMIIHERVKNYQGWGMIWITRPELIDNLLLDAPGLDVLLTQQAAFCISLDNDSPISKTLRGMGQKLWEFLPDILNHEEARKRILNEVAGVLNESLDERNVRAAALWDWMVPRLIGSIERHQLRYQVEIDRQTKKMMVARQTLNEYKRNWIANTHNDVEAYLQRKASGQNFKSFYDAKKAGPETNSYLSAISLSGLWRKLNDIMTDRMAEFVGSLSALATKIELRQIALQDIDTRWNPSHSSSSFEKLLKSNDIFPDNGGVRLGLVGTLTGKSDEIIQNRKSEIARAGRIISQAIEADFSEWCDTFMTAVERQVKIQIAARLANEGLPEGDALKTAISGLDRLAAILKGDDSSRKHSPEAIASEWLTSFSERRWIPLYSRAETVS